tara:strand:+ start:212 stop:520 length:309 start_codon:yes stop_codon:yes gene_type:complete
MTQYMKNKILSQKKMPTSRTDIAAGKGLQRSKSFTPQTSTSRSKLSRQSVPPPPPPRTIVLPNMRKMCAIFLFFLGSFAVGFGAGFGSGYSAKICEVANDMM